MEIEINIPPKLYPLSQPYRYKVLHGGRGSAKSWSIARLLLVKSCQKKIRVLCTREIMKSLKDSVYKLLEDQINMLGLAPYFYLTRESITCKLTGSEFLFCGLAETSVDSIKSYENIDICWIEEAQSISQRSWDILRPTIRATGSEIWISFNPHLKDDPIYNFFITNGHIIPPQDLFIQQMNWRDNPYFGPEPP